MSHLALSDYTYDLPETLIAQQPAQPRDHARLLIYDRARQTITDDYFYNLDTYLVPDTTLVLNNSRVEKSRLRFKKMEVFVIEAHDDTTITAMVFPGKKFKRGAMVEVTKGVCFTVTDIMDDGLRRLASSVPMDDPRITSHRYTPLPPYIAQDESLSEEYQTVYAKPLGSKAAPTAGLHFTDDLLTRLSRTHQIAELTLHVGLGTFAPLKAEHIEENRLHKERFIINEHTAKQLNAAAHRTAVGTTTARVLESVPGEFREMEADTDIFIHPGHTWNHVDSLITNFHLPKSSLLMLVAAFMGYEEMMRVYAHAIEQKYRFYSFGDAMLIL